MVGVGVRDHDALHVGRLAAQFGDGPEDGAGCVGPADVDDGEAVLGDDLVADAVPPDVVEPRDGEVAGERAGVGAAEGVAYRGGGDRVVHDDGDLLGVVDQTSTKHCS